MPFENVTVAVETLIARGMDRHAATRWVMTHAYTIGAQRQLFVDLPVK